MFNTLPKTTNTNPIFSSYSVRSADFNENMDEYVKAPNDIYVEEQKKKQAVNNNVNADAVKNIRDIPDFLKEEYDEVYKMPEWLEKLNVCSQDEIEEWKNKGGMGIAEAWDKHKKWQSFLPYVNTTKNAADAITASVLLNRAKKGEELTYEQQDKLVDYLRDIKELQVRGFTFGGGTVNAILTSIPYLEEFGIGLATSESGVGLAALGKTLGTIGAKKAARKAVEAALKEASIKSAAPAAVKTTVSLSAAKKIYKDTLINTSGVKALANVGAKEALKQTGKALPKALATSARFGLTKMPETFMGGIADRQLATGVYVTDMGDAVFTDSEHLALSIMKSLGDSTFEALTETAGWTFSPVVSYFAKPLQKILPKKFFTEFEKLVSSRYGIPASKALKKYGYDGVIEEMGEELLNRFLCQTFGINGLDEYNFDGFMNNVFYADNPSQWGQEALSFAAVGSAGHIVAGGGSKISHEWQKRQDKKDIQNLTDKMNKYIQSPEQFYLEQGLIKIKGSQSAAEQKLRDIWTSQNIDEGLQDDVLKNMSESEIRTELKKNVEEQAAVLTPETAVEKIENTLTNTFLENKTFSDDKKAKSIAALFAAPLQKLSETAGLSLEEVMENEMPAIQNEAMEASKENGRYILTDGKIEDIFEEFNSLPNDFSDEQYMSKLMFQADILSKIRDGILQENELDKAYELINDFENSGETELANELRELTFSKTPLKGRISNTDDEYFQTGIQEIDNSVLYDKLPQDLKNAVDFIYNGESVYHVTGNEFPKGEGNIIDRVANFYEENFNSKANVENFGEVLLDRKSVKNSSFHYFSEKKINAFAAVPYVLQNGKMANYQENYKGKNEDRYLFVAPITIQENGQPEKYFCEVVVKATDRLNSSGVKRFYLHEVELKKKLADVFLTPSGRTSTSSKSIIADLINKLNPSNQQSKREVYYQTNYTEQLEDAKANREYKKFVNKVLNNKLSNKEKRQLFQIGRTPAKLIEAGFPKNNISIGHKIIEKAQDNRNQDHNLSKETISNVYQALKNPIAVIKAEQNKNEKAPNNRYSVVLDLQEEGHYVLAAFEVDKNTGSGVILNDIRSIHSRENYAPLIDKAFNENRLIKIDREKIKNLLLGSSDIISEGGQASSEKDLLNSKIHTELISDGVASLIDKIYQQQNNVKLYQAAYNGSPNNFDKFSTDYIGSGEGNQVHGWGLYFSENKETAENYRNRLRGIEEQTLEGANKILGQLNECIKYAKSKKNKITEDALDLYNSMEYRYENKSDLMADLRDGINKQKEHIKHIKQVLREKGNNKSQVYKVDIPESDVLLDEDKIFNEQSENVQEALEKILKDDEDGQLIDYSILQEQEDEDGYPITNLWLGNITDNSLTGKEIYESISLTMRETYGIEKGEADKLTSQLLNRYGIKGITYDGRQDGRCYVIFDDKAVKVLEKYYQEAPIQTNLFYDNITPRKLQNMNIKGAFIPAENLIELFKNADESTIVHEFAHWWLSRLEKYAAKSEELALDLDEVRKFVKNNGEEFTREQHEKFASGFEAYIRNGSARSNRLKKIFEDFKNALLSIYDSLKKIVYTENSKHYSFNEADVENLNKLFERLLTTESERIRKTVFDRCDDINDKIKEIKSRQEQEMKELDEIWKDNIAINNRKSDKKRKVEEYLELAEKMTARESKEVKEFKQRYKKATLDILSQATGYSKQFIANSRNLEKVELALDKTEDKLTVNGFAPEWGEFYTDTGVSYDNEDVNGGYELARQAFDVLKNDSYDKTFDNDYRFEDINKFTTKFEYLYNKVKTLKGEEKETALEALYSLFEKMPSVPDDVSESIINKLGEISQEYEEEQKQDFNRKSYPSIPVMQQLQYYVTNKLSELKVYDPNFKYKIRISKSHSLYKAIKNATSVNSTKRIIRKINEYVISDLENQAKSILHKEIQKQIKVNSKLVKVGTLTKGKFDWKTNTVFAELAELNKLKQKEAFKEYGAMIELDKAAMGEERENDNENPLSTPEFKTDFQSNLKRKFLEYRSNKIADLNLLATRSLLEDILALKFEGRRAKDIQELEKQLQKDNMKTDLAQRVRALKGNKAAQEVAKFIMGETPLTSEKTLANWESSLNALFGKEVAQRYSLLKLESDAEVYAYKHYADFCQKAIEIYGLNNPVNAKEKFMDKFNRFVDFGNVQPLIKLMQEYEEEVYNFRETTFSKETGQYIETGAQLSRAEIITLYAWSMNDELEQRILTQYGFSQVRYMFDEILTDEDKQFAWLLIDTCENMYDENNEVFIRTMGLSLPKVENYFPSKTVRVGSEIDMLHENIVRSSNPSFIKQRKSCNRIKMKPESPISILLPHINKTARYVILSERLNYLNAIFKDGTVRAAIKEVFDGVEIPFSNVGERAKGKRSKQKRTVGDRIHDTLLNQLGSSTFENYVRGLNVGKSWADTLASNYITSRIGGNLKVMFGQLTSVINYAEKMPAGLWSKGFAECLKTPKETIKYMLDNCDYLRARIAGNTMNEIMTKITDETDRFRTLRNFCTTNTKYGDILAISFGGKPYVDYLIKQGMTEGEAFERFVEDTLRAQQSGHNSATSVWQKKMSENFFTRMMFAFNNTNLQYERKFLDAISARTKGEIDNKELIKAILLYRVFNPILFTSFLGNLSFMQLIGSLIRGDDDDSLSKFGIDAISSVIFANMGAYGFAGMGISTLLQFLMTLLNKKEYKPFLKTIPVIGDIEEIGKELILKNEVTFADWVDAIALVGDDATGVPVSRLVNIYGGMGDMVRGDFGVGALRMLGYGNYRANVAVTGKPPEK